MVCLCDFMFMVCDEEEDPKSQFNGWLKAYNIAIDLGEQFRQNQEPKTRNRNMQPTGRQAGSTQQAALRAMPRYSRENVAWAAFPWFWCGAARQDLTRSSVPSCPI